MKNKAKIMIPNIHMFIIIITLSGVCSFLYSANLQSQEALGNPSTHALNKNWNPDQQKAIEIADQELLKHFSDHGINDYGINLVEKPPVPTNWIRETSRMTDEMERTLFLDATWDRTRGYFLGLIRIWRRSGALKARSVLPTG